MPAIDGSITAVAQLRNRGRRIGAALLGFGARHHHERGGAVKRQARPMRWRWYLVPSFLKGRAQVRDASSVVAPARIYSSSATIVALCGPWIVTGDLVLEAVSARASVLFQDAI